jgi:hypothetical protein
MRDGLGPTLLRAFVVAAAVAGAMTLYRHERRPPPLPVVQAPVPRSTVMASPPTAPEPALRPSEDGTIDLGNLSTIGMGGLPQCSPDVVTPWVLKVQSVYREASRICDAIRPLGRTIRSCLDAGLKEDALRGDFVALYISIGENGRVGSSVMDNGNGERGSAAEARLDACLRRATRHLRLGRGEADEVALDMDLF